LESHGHYDPVSEIATNAFSSIKNLKVAYSDDAYIAIQIENENESKSLFVFTFKDNSKTSNHQIKIEDKTYEWVGPYQLIDNN
jgi:hypothetical protein